MGWIAKAQGSGIFSAAIMGTTAVVLASTLLTTVTHLRMHELRDSLLASNEKADELRNLTLLSRVSMINQRAMAADSNSWYRTCMPSTVSGLASVMPPRWIGSIPEMP